ncbi:hypothetical protein BCV69DRAFT_13860 [Microstroma glucosiphilum]|uniref:Transcription and mRNA export factor SUS1 n=1 Tax=Pseudomicrostroma glucosiphilum TaxID=1684307 RepID=A0A316UFE0_9BASI|nr:hypothetical protein BCV69DRAFT_13860 [Pseudomicrostroma glucosiphilum]PWN23930.1 hypothetical protein BCV69DRAFT_13860 [Pseudomicrostroma glucosiphilum]
MSGAEDQQLSETDELYQALHHRLVTTGEWHRLSILLEQQLLDSNWAVDLSNHAEAKARKMPELDLDELVKSVLDEGQQSVPSTVKRKLMEQIKDFLDRNVEDA